MSRDLQRSFHPCVLGAVKPQLSLQNRANLKCNIREGGLIQKRLGGRSKPVLESVPIGLWRLVWEAYDKQAFREGKNQNYMGSWSRQRAWSDRKLVVSDR